MVKLKKRTSVLAMLGVASCIAIGGALVFANSGVKNAAVKGSVNDYTISFEEGVNAVADSFAAKTHLGNDVEFAASNAAAAEGKWAALGENGYVYNVDKISQIQGIYLDFTGSLDIAWGFDSDNLVRYKEIRENLGYFDFDHDLPNYFFIHSSTGASIEAMRVVFNCVAEDSPAKDFYSNFNLDYVSKKFTVTGSGETVYFESLENIYVAGHEFELLGRNDNSLEYIDKELYATITFDEGGASIDAILESTSVSGTLGDYVPVLDGSKLGIPTNFAAIASYDVKKEEPEYAGTLADPIDLDFVATSTKDRFVADVSKYSGNKYFKFKIEEAGVYRVYSSTSSSGSRETTMSGLYSADAPTVDIKGNSNSGGWSDATTSKAGCAECGDYIAKSNWDFYGEIQLAEGEYIMYAYIAANSTIPCYFGVEKYDDGTTATRVDSLVDTVTKRLEFVQSKAFLAEAMKTGMVVEGDKVYMATLADGGFVYRAESLVPITVEMFNSAYSSMSDIADSGFDFSYSMGPNDIFVRELTGDTSALERMFLAGLGIGTASTRDELIAQGYADLDWNIADTVEMFVGLNGELVSMCAYDSTLSSPVNYMIEFEEIADVSFEISKVTINVEDEVPGENPGTQEDF